MEAIDALDSHISQVQVEVTPCWDGERLFCVCYICLDGS